MLFALLHRTDTYRTRTPEENVTARPIVHADPDTGIPDLVRRLTDDSKRLAGDEVRLAKLELHESVRTGARGTLWLAIAFGVAVVALVALTVFLVAIVGRIANGNYWAGALIVGLLEAGVGYFLIRRGLSAFKEPSYTLEESRAALKDTAAWVRRPRTS